MIGGFYPDDYHEPRPDDLTIANYKCQTCGNPQQIDDYQKHTPNWCKSCETIRTFVTLKS